MTSDMTMSAQHLPAVPQAEYVPFPDNPWDEVARNLFVGGHLAQCGRDCHPGDNFDLVVSLVNEGPEFEPTSGAILYYLFDDDELEPGHHIRIEMIAMLVHEAVSTGHRVLVRCHGGINRSALIAGLAMVRGGRTPYQAVQALRKIRSPYCLFNDSFANYLESKW